MGLACSNVRFLALTRQKSNIQHQIMLTSSAKISLSREMSDLTKEYNSKLQSKNITYYKDGSYKKINYGFLMGFGSNYAGIFDTEGYAVKNDNSMILSNYKGQVVLANSYANAIISALGSSVSYSAGNGGTFSEDSIPAILAKLFPDFTEEQFSTVLNNEELSSSFDADVVNTATREDVGDTVVNNSAIYSDKIRRILEFYYPIFSAAAANGWTTEYNQAINNNPDYVSDALISGMFQLTSVNDKGQYDERGSLDYYVTSGFLEERTDAEERTKITAWYDDMRAQINEKETAYDLTLNELSTTLESINVEMQSIKKLVQDGCSVFDWGKS